MPIPPVLAAILALAAACGTRDPVWSQAPRTLGPVSAAGDLVWLQRPADLLVAIDPAAAALRRLNIPTQIRAVQPVPKGVLLAGGRGDDPVLALVTLPGLEMQRIPVSGVFDAIAVPPDGRHAILYRIASSPPAPGGPPARNNNEIAVADLERAKTTPVALQTESLAPTGVVFSPDSSTAAILLDSAVVLLDVADPAKRVQVPLKLPNGRALAPAKALFAPDAAYLYILAGGSDDVLALEVRREGSTMDSSVNFLFFPGAAGPRDLLVPAGAAFSRFVAAVYPSGGKTKAVLLDATGDAARTRSVELGAAYDSMADPGEGLLLLYADGAKGAGGTSVAAWDPMGGRVDEDRLPAAPAGAPGVSAGLAFFSRFRQSAASSTITAVKLEGDGARVRVRLSPLQLAGPAVAAVVHPADGSLFAGVAIARDGSGAAPLRDGTFSGNTGAIVSVQPGTFAIAGLALDAEIQSMGVTGDWVWAVHSDSLGDVTLVPRASTDRDHALRFEGVLAEGLLDRDGEE